MQITTKKNDTYHLVSVTRLVIAAHIIVSDLECFLSALCGFFQTLRNLPAVDIEIIAWRCAALVFINLAVETAIVFRYLHILCASWCYLNN